MAHQEDNDRAELAKKSFERLKLVSQGLTGTQAGGQRADFLNGQTLLMPNGKTSIGQSQRT